MSFNLGKHCLSFLFKLKFITKNISYKCCRSRSNIDEWKLKYITREKELFFMCERNAWTNLIMKYLFIRRLQFFFLRSSQIFWISVYLMFEFFVYHCVHIISWHNTDIDYKTGFYNLLHKINHLWLDDISTKSTVIILT